MTTAQCKKIAVIGVSGSGKTTVGREISAKTGIPIFHVDPLLWRGNWESVPHDEYIKEHEILLDKPKWIIEGYVDKEMSDRLKKADLVLYLNYSNIRCAYRVMSRWWEYRNKNRPEFPKEAHEKFDVSLFIRVLIGFEKNDINEALETSKPHFLVTIHSPKELRNFMKAEIYEPLPL